MSTQPESDLSLDLHFLPSWAQQPANRNLYSNYQGETGERDRRGERGDYGRPDRDRDRGPRGPRRDSGPRDTGPRSPARRDEGRGRPSPGGRPSEARREDDREHPRERLPLPELRVAFRPDEQTTESLVRQIKMTGRAYPLFEVAAMVFKHADRLDVVFETVKKPDGTPAQTLFHCALDDTLWLTPDEAVAHVLNRHFNTFYQAERTPTDPPKGVYTFVGQCSLSGIVLGPPNHHDYQNQLRRLHAERFARMPFDVYKSRVRIVRDEAVVKKWIEDQSWKTVYSCLNVPDAAKLETREAVELHFRETHAANIIRPVEKHTLSGAAARKLACSGLQRLLRFKLEEQRRFPMQVATSLSTEFAKRSLQFFKVAVQQKKIIHVCVARPHFLDLEATPVSESVLRIVTFIRDHPRCTRRKLIEALVPGLAMAPAPSAPTPAPEVAAATATPPAGEGAPTTPVSEAATATPAPVAPPTIETSPEAAAIVGDLHWLIHQGHVIEFARGELETAKKPHPKPEPPPKAAIKPAAAATAPTSTTAPGAEAPAADTSIVTAESLAAEVAATPAPAESALGPDAAPAGS